MALSLHPVRQLAQAFGYEERGVDHGNSVVSFVPRHDTTLHVSIYYHTGTVRVRWGHHLVPACAQVVLLRVTLDKLSSLLQNPRSCGSFVRLQKSSTEPEVTMLQKHNAYLDAALERLTVERRELDRVLGGSAGNRRGKGGISVLGAKRRFDEMMRISLPVRDCRKETAGRCRHWTFFPDEVTQLWRKGDVKCVAMVSRATVMLYGSGKVEGTSELPAFLRHQLMSPGKSGIDYLCLGSHGRYFLRFFDGRVDWCGGCDLFNQLVKNRGSNSVVCVAFGATSNVYFVKFSDGALAWNGLSLEFSRSLKRCSSRHGEVADVSLGPRGEWWVKFQDNHWECGSVMGEVREVLQQLQRQGRQLQSVVFGGEHAYFIQYC